MSHRDYTGHLIRPRIGSKIRIRGSDSVPEFATFWAGKSHESVEVALSSVGIVLGPASDIQYCWQVAFGGKIALVRLGDFEVID